MIRYYFETKNSSPVKLTVPDEDFEGRPAESYMVCIYAGMRPDIMKHLGGLRLIRINYEDLPDEIKAWLIILGVNLG